MRRCAFSERNELIFPERSVRRVYVHIQERQERQHVLQDRLSLNNPLTLNN